MFAGAGDFFRPVELRKDVSPAAAIRPAARSGDEPQKNKGDEPHQDKDDSLAAEFSDGYQGADTTAGYPVITEEGFSGDALELSIAALFVLLTGGAQGAAVAVKQPPAQPGFGADAAAPVPAPAQQAFDAYHRAAAALKPMAAALPKPPAPVATAGTPDAGTEIFHMLAALEKAGVRSLSVTGGETIYAALRAQCRRLDISLALPAAGPDNRL